MSSKILSTVNASSRAVVVKSEFNTVDFPDVAKTTLQTNFTFGAWLAFLKRLSPENGKVGQVISVEANVYGNHEGQVFVNNGYADYSLYLVRNTSNIDLVNVTVDEMNDLCLSDEAYPLIVGMPVPIVQKLGNSNPDASSPVLTSTSQMLPVKIELEQYMVQPCTILLCVRSHSQITQTRFQMQLFCSLIMRYHVKSLAVRVIRQLYDAYTSIKSVL